MAFELPTIHQSSPADNLLRLLPYGAAYIDSAYVYRYVNPAFAQLSALDGAALNGKHVQDIGCLKEVPDLLHTIHHYEEPVEFSCQTGAHEGLYELQVVADKDDKDQLQGYVLTCMPVSATADLYHQMIEEVEDYAILLLDKHGNIRNWNKGAQKIKGYLAHEIVGKNFKIFYRQHDREKGLPEQLIATAGTYGRAIHEGWRLKKNGSVFWGSIVITAIHDDANNVIGFTKVTRDLTERKLAEDQLRANAMELESQNRELQQFAYIASHDMKEPLRKISLYNDMLLSNVPEEQVGPAARHYLLKIASAANRMQHLIEDVLEYSKISFLPGVFAPVNLGQVLAEILEFHQDQLTEIGASVHTGVLPTVPGIAHQLRQLFDNLISNAVKYRSPERPLEIRIDCSNEALEGNGINTGHKDAVRIVIKDNGIGFHMEYAEKIFELFQRLVGKTEYAGTGIGLALCKKIVQNHNGKIKASGNEQGGAVFEVILPMV